MSSSPRGDDVQAVTGQQPSATAEPSEDPGSPTGAQASVDVMRLLSEHVPLTLLADLAQPTGPDSPDILEHEGLPTVAWWKTEERH